MHNGCVQDCVSGWDGGLDTVVRVGILMDDWLNDVLDVVMVDLLDEFTLVYDLTIQRSLSNGGLVSTSDGIQESSVAIGGRVLFVDLSDWVSLGFDLFGTVFFMLDRLNVVLDMGVVVVLFLQSLDLFDFVSTLSVVSDVTQVVDFLSDVGWVSTR